MIQDALRKLDLDDKEIALYLRLLQLGPNRASTLAYQLGLPRTTVQNILNRLEKEDIVYVSYEKNVNVYTPTYPSELIELLEVRKRRMSLEFTQTEKDLKSIMPQ